MLKLTAIFFIMLVNSSLFSQDSLTIELVKKFAYPLFVDGHGLSGQGWDSLKRDIANSQFFLIGENHSSPKLSEFMASVFPAIKPFGYKHFIIETGPIASRKIVELYRKDKKNYAQSLYAFHTKYGLGKGKPPIEFAAMKTDPAMYRSAIENGFSIQGIDKEYLYSTYYLLDELATFCTTAECRSRHSKAISALAPHVEKYKTDDSYSFINSVKKDPTIVAFAQHVKLNHPKAMTTVDELEKHWKIYGLYEDNLGYMSEDVRIDNLKRSFSSYYRSHKTEDFKAIIKYGLVHTEKGMNRFGLADLGNMIYQLSYVNNTKSLHIMGMRRYRVNDEGGTDDYLNDGYEVYPSFMNLASKENWILIDLKPLRSLLNARKIKASNDEKSLIRMNDWILFTPLDGAHKTSMNYD